MAPIKDTGTQHSRWPDHFQRSLLIEETHT
jgi:hypothetical protein